MKSLFIEFLRTSTKDSYEKLRQALLTDVTYHPYSDELIIAEGLLQAGQYERTRELLSQAMPNLLLSPRTHQMLAYIADRLGDFSSRYIEAAIAGKLCEGIMATGGGTKVSPLLVSRTSDQHDLLNYLGRRLSKQSLHDYGTQQFDCVTCQDGTSLWFDVTDQLSHSG